MVSSEENRVLNLFSFVEEAGIIVCKYCEHGIDNLSSLRSHLKISKHSDVRHIKVSAKTIRQALLKGTSWETDTECISKLPSCFGGNISTVNQIRYQNAPNQTDVLLPRITQLPIHMGFVCKDCTVFCDTSDERTLGHFMTSHARSVQEATNILRERAREPLQSLGQGTKKRFFPVFVSSVGEMMNLKGGTKGFTNRYQDATENIAVDEFSIPPELLSSQPLFPRNEEQREKSTRNGGQTLEEELLELFEFSSDDENLMKTNAASQEEENASHQSKKMSEFFNGQQKSVSVTKNSGTTNLEKGDHQFVLGARKPDESVEILFNAIRHCVDPSKWKLDKDYNAIEKEYFDTPFHELISQMPVGFSRMIKESHFCGTLKKVGFKYLGSVVTAICFSASRMVSAMKKIIIRANGHVSIKTLDDGNGMKNLRQQKISETDTCILGKANTPLVLFLSGLEIFLDRHRNPELLQSLCEDDQKLPCIINVIERQIQRNVKSYLCAAAKATNAAPNFVRSLVVAHNKVFSTISSKRSTSLQKQRTDRRVSGSAGLWDENSDGVVNAPRVNFFKAVTTSKSIHNYGDNLSLIVLAAVRITLVKYFLSATPRNYSQDNSPRMNVRELSQEISAIARELENTVGSLTWMDDFPELQSAVFSCLCSVGFCLHISSDGSGRSISLHTVHRGCSSPCFINSSNKKGFSLPLLDEENMNATEQPVVSAFQPSLIGIHWIFRALFLSESTKRNTTDSLFLPKFLALVSIADPMDDVKQRRFRDAHQLTPMTAALAYGMKCCGIVEMCRNRQDWITFSGGVSFKDSLNDPNETISEENKQERKEWLLSQEQVSRCYSTSHNTASSYLVGIHNKLRECAESSNDYYVRFVECMRPDHAVGRCGLVNGKECSLDTIANGVRKWQKEAKHILHEKLFLGMNLPDGFENKISLLNDDFRDSGRGRSFASLERHVKFSEEWAISIVKHIWSEECLFHEFFGKSIYTDKTAGKRFGSAPRSAVTPDHFRGMELRKIRLQRYLDDCQEVLKRLLACLHVIGGGTARSTEMEYLFKNSAESHRNIFVFQGELVFIARYNKNEAARGRTDIIARFPDSESSKLLIKYLLFVKPVEEVFMHYLHGENIAEAHGLHCFADVGKPYSGDKCRREIVDLFQKAEIPFGFLEYRHYFAAMARKHLSKHLLKNLIVDLQDFESLDRVSVHPVAGFIPQNPFETTEQECIPDEETSHTLASPLSISRGRIPDLSSIFPIHEQAGHTRATADRIYGLSATDMSGLGHSKLEAFRMTSRAWQSTLGLYADREKRLLLSTENEPRGKRWKRERENLTEDKCPNIVIEKGCFQEIQRSCQKTQKDIVTDAVEITERTAPNSEGLNAAEGGRSTVTKFSNDDLFHPANQALPIHISSDRMSVLLKSLREMKKDEGAKFRSMEQVFAIDLMLQRQTDLFVVMPTGHGKTDMMLLTSFIEQSLAKKTGMSVLSILIVPIIALSIDIMRRCEAAGIRAGLWSQDQHDVNSLTILIVSVEQVEKRDFAGMISEQANKGRLARILMEECQTTANWIDFRPSYVSLKGSMRPGGIHVPVVLASATVPFHQTARLAEKHGVTQFHELRIATVRSNLSYSVRQVAVIRFVSLEQNICQETIKALKQHMKNWKRCGGQIIIYCPTLRLRSLLSSLLIPKRFEHGIGSLLSYDSSLTSGQKARVMEHWYSFQAERISLAVATSPKADTIPKFQVVVATCGFGMGVDSPFVRSVIHMGYSRSIAEYVQESGRAGRDGKRATCELLLSRNLVEKELYLISNSTSDQLEEMRLDSTTLPSLDFSSRRRKEKDLLDFVHWAENNTSCRRQSLFWYMDRTRPEMCLFERNVQESNDFDVAHVTGIAREEKTGHTYQQVGSFSLCDFCHRLDEKSKVSCSTDKTQMNAMRLNDLHGNVLQTADTTDENQSFSQKCDRDGDQNFINQTNRRFSHNQICDVPQESRIIDGEQESLFKSGVQKNFYENKGSLTGNAIEHGKTENGGIPSTYHLRATEPSSGQFLTASDLIQQKCTVQPVGSSSGYARILSDVKKVSPFHNSASVVQSWNALERSEVERRLSVFKGLCIEIGQLCPVCVVKKGIRRKLDVCQREVKACLRSCCYRCNQSSHSANECELIPFRMRLTGSRKFQPKDNERRNHCYACGMDRWINVRMHQPVEFSRVDKCPYIPAFQMAAIAWEDASWKRRISEKFDLRRITALDASVKSLQDVVFFRWLRETNGVNRHKLHLMELIEFILSEYSNPELKCSSSK